MKSIALIQAEYDQARADYLAQVAYMNTQNLATAERHGGVDSLRENPTSDAAKRFLGIERRLIQLAAFEDAAENLIQRMQQVIDDQFEEIDQLRRENKLMKRRIENREPEEFISQRDWIQLVLCAPHFPVPVVEYMKRDARMRYARVAEARRRYPHLFDEYVPIENENGEVITFRMMPQKPWESIQQIEPINGTIKH